MRARNNRIVRCAYGVYIEDRVGARGYDLPTVAARKVVHNILGNWSLNSFLIVRSAPPVDIVGAQISAEMAVFMRRPDVKPGLPLVLYGAQCAPGLRSVASRHRFAETDYLRSYLRTALQAAIMEVSASSIRLAVRDRSSLRLL
jgi:hypothetical protein